MVLAAGIAVADYQFTNHGLDGQTELFSRDEHAVSVASDISSPLPLGSTGNGEPPRGLALGGAFDEVVEPTPATNSTDYFTFTITPNAGQSLDLADLSFSVRRNDPDSKNSFAIYYDEDPGAGGDNFSTRLFAGVVVNEDVFERQLVSLEGQSPFINLTTAITFRYYAWGTAGLGTQRIDNVRVRAVAETVSSSAYAYYGDADRLIHPLDELGNRVPDFSAAGYHYGADPIPDVTQTIPASRIITVEPAAGDDMQNIQAAIDQVATFSPDADGFRGVVQLVEGEYQVSDQLLILTGGIVLRGVGDGDDPSANTILRATGTARRSLIQVGEASGFASGVGGSRAVVEKVVPVGASSFRIDSTDGWNVGDPIIVRRPSTEEWIAAIGMDSIPPRSDGGTVVQWAAGQYDHLYERIITRIEGDRIHINAPLMSALDQQYGGGLVFQYTFPRIAEVGIENLRGVSDFASDTDEDHARTFIELQAVQNAWVRNVTGQHFVYATVHATSRAIGVTVDDARSLEPKSQITGGRRYPFTIDGQFILMQNLYSEEGRHDFVNNSRTRNRGPNVFLNGTAVNSHSTVGPHQRFSTGTLYDTIRTDFDTEARNRGNFGTGHGWAGANMVFWNNVARGYLVQNPPTAQNWLIGSVGTIVDDTRFGPQPPATVDAHGTPIDFGDAENPLSSLYVAQRNRADGDIEYEHREYVLGDFDQVEFDGTASDDAVFVDADWLSQISTIAGTAPIGLSDEVADAQVVPLSFQYPLEPGYQAYAAVLTLGLRGTSGISSDDVLYLDSVNQPRSLADLGVAGNLPDAFTTPITIELTGQDLQLLDDGLLNLAVSDSTVVDWAHLELQIGIERTLTLQVANTTIRETGQTLATVTRTGDTSGPLTITLGSTDDDEATVPASVIIAAGQHVSPQFAIMGIDDGVRDLVQTVTLTASAPLYTDATINIDVQDVLAHRISELEITVQDPEGNPLPDAIVDVAMTRHAFKFGSQVRDRLFAITESDFEALTETEKQNLLPDLESQFGIPRTTPTWQDVLNYREAVFENFNHIVPTIGMQWITLNNNGPSVPDAAFALAQENVLSVTGASVVWQRDRWPTPLEFRSDANPDPQAFHDALIRDRLGNNGVLQRFSPAGDGPTVTDWKLLNEPIHEHYHADTFVGAGIYDSEVAALTDYFERAAAIRPDATLSINEFNIISAPSDAAAIAYRDLVNALLAADAPISRVGIQAHIGRNDITRADISRRLDILAETGLPIEISEFDTRDDANQLSPTQQEAVFRDILEAAFEHPSVDGFIMWGFWDPGHWRGNGPLFDSSWNAKAEAAPWFELVRGEWMPNLTGLSVDTNATWRSNGSLFDGLYDITASAQGFSRTVSGYELTEDGQLTITIPIETPRLELTIDPESFSENGGSAQATVSRSGSTSASVDVQLSSSDLSEVTIPSTVTIPAGASSAVFTVTGVDDELIDGLQTITITASAVNHETATASIDVTDDDQAALSLSLEQTMVGEHGESVQVTVSRNTSPTSNLLVTLAYGDGLTGPASLFIPAGLTSSSFSVTGVDDQVVNGDRSVVLQATATDHASANQTVVVVDDDEPQLSLSVDDESISEGGTTLATVFRNTDSSDQLTVMLFADDDDRVSLPDSVTIPSGAASVSFEITSVENGLADGTQTVGIQASAAEHAGASASVGVEDDDTAALSLVVTDPDLAENGGRTQVSVRRNTLTNGDLVVMLTTDDPPRVTVPATVTIPAGQSQASFEITTLDNVLVEGTVQVQLAASATRHATATDLINILDDDFWTWTNAVDRFDVNDDGAVSPIDALLVINHLNGTNDAQLPELTDRPPHFLDVSEDGFATPLDALMVINALNSQLSGEAELASFDLALLELELERRRAQLRNRIASILQLN